MPIAKFRIINTELSGREYNLPDHPVIVGRGSNSDLVIPDQSVSRQHVRAEVQNGHCILTDLGSQNGIVAGGRTLREAAVTSGDRFELGDVAIEFLLMDVQSDDAAGTALDVPAVAVPEGYELARPTAAPPSERPVYVDDVFGSAAMEAEIGPGEEEKAAVAGARGAARYLVLLAVIVAIGAVAWHLAGRQAAEPNIRVAIVQAGERKVIDLGLTTRMERSRTVPYIDNRDVYDEIADPGDEEIAALELDPTGFMAVVEGINLGETDVKLVSSQTGRTAIVRILVRGFLPRPAWEERLTPDERLARGRQLIRDGKAAMSAGHLYKAKKSFREATFLLDPVRNAQGNRTRREADDLFHAAREKLDDEFRELKNLALARRRSLDRVGAWAVWQRLLNAIPDPDDELNQKLRIIYDRTLYDLRRGGS